MLSQEMPVSQLNVQILRSEILIEVHIDPELDLNLEAADLCSDMTKSNLDPVTSRRHTSDLISYVLVVDLSGAKLKFVQIWIQMFASAQKSFVLFLICMNEN